MPRPSPSPPIMAAAAGPGFFGMLSFRRSATAVASFDPAQDDELLALDALQAHVDDRLAALSSHAQAQPAAPVLSLPFLSKLLDAVLSSDDAFRAVLALAPVAAALSRPPAARLAADLLDHAVKTLDVLNAASLTLASLRAAHRAASCLLAPALHRAHFARARRAISRLFPDDSRARAASPSPSSRTMRALSLSVSKNWSAGRHMNAMAPHLAPPPQASAAAAAGAGCGLGLALYTMTSVLVFAMWAMVAAVPCQDRASAAINPPVEPPKQAQWATPMSSLQDRIAEEWRRREKKGSSSGSGATAGLLAEMQAVERAARDLHSLLEEIAEEEEDEQAAVAVVSEERAREVTERAEELSAACRALEDGLPPLERQVRAVFHRVVACRAEVVRCMENSARSGSSNAAASASGVPPPQHHS